MVDCLPTLNSRVRYRCGSRTKNGGFLRNPLERGKVECGIIFAMLKGFFYFFLATVYPSRLHLFFRRLHLFVCLKNGKSSVFWRWRRRMASDEALNPHWMVSYQRTRSMYLSNAGGVPPDEQELIQKKMGLKANLEYKNVAHRKPTPDPTKPPTLKRKPESEPEGKATKIQKSSSSSTAMALYNQGGEDTKSEVSSTRIDPNALQLAKKQYAGVMPSWHPPWKLFRVISGHTGWVRAVAVDVSNKWFATGAADRCIKIWDLASGELKLTLTGHIHTVRGLAVSPKHTYLFSCAEDKMVKCWDLEYNKVIRHYHGHLSGVYSMALHPTIDLLMTGGRDSAVRVWDIRTKAQAMTLTGHTNGIDSIVCQGTDPQVISGSADSTIRCWDLRNGKAMVVLTNHKKSVRSLALHPSDFTFASGGADNIKKWELPDAKFMKNFSGHNTIIYGCSVNHDNVLFSGGDNGTMKFWDWKTGHCFQSMETKPQPGSLSSEAGILCSSFDQTGQRLICGEVDKTIKLYKPDETATEESHPVIFNPTKGHKRW